MYTKFLLTYTAVYRGNGKVLSLGITALQPQSHFHLGMPYSTDSIWCLPSGKGLQRDWTGLVAARWQRCWGSHCFAGWKDGRCDQSRWKLPLGEPASWYIHTTSASTWVTFDICFGNYDDNKGSCASAITTSAVSSPCTRLHGVTFQTVIIIFQYISNKMQRYMVYLYLETALHISGGTSTQNM